MDKTRELIEIGKQYFHNKDYSKAKDCLKKVVSQKNKYADVYNMLGVIAHIQGNFGSAIDMLEQSLKLNPQYSEAILNLAILYNDLGQYKKAQKLYTKLDTGKNKRVRHIEPVLCGKLSNMHAELGDIYQSIGEQPLAITEYEKALQLNPSYSDIRTKLAQALRENGKFDDSLLELKKVIKQDPYYVPAYIQKGVTLHTMQKKGLAIRAWEKTLHIDPKNQTAKMYLRLSAAIKENK